MTQKQRIKAIKALTRLLSISTSVPLNNNIIKTLDTLVSGI